MKKILRYSMMCLMAFMYGQVNAQELSTCADVIAGEDGTVFRVKGTVDKITNTEYGNWILKDETGEITIYGTLDKEGNKGKNNSIAAWGIEVGDVLTVEGARKTYKETIELVDVKVLDIQKGSSGSGTIQEISVAKALEIINAMDDGGKTPDEYQVKGFVVGTPDFQRNAKNNNELYGNVNLTIADEKGGSTTLTIYRANSFGGEKFTEDDLNLIKEGDEVVFQGVLQKYVSKSGEMTPELAQGGYLISVNGTTTGISDMKVQKADAPIYNLAGQRVEKATKGIFIQNGKKFVVK